MISLRRFFGHSLAGLALFIAAGSVAQATPLTSGSFQILATDPTQLGRLSRDGVPSYWGDPTLPSVINPTTSYHYKTVDLDLTALEAGFDYGSFIEISFDSASATTFISAYLDSYSPANILTNWLGDAGSSGNYFGPDAIAFDVTVPVGHHLLLVMNESVTNGGLNMLGNFVVNAYSDDMYTDLAVATAPVPEPATWGLMIGGLALLAGARKRRVGSSRTQPVASN